MKANELRGKTDDELASELEGLNRESFNLRMQKSTRQLSRYSRVKEVRRTIERIKTIMTERASKSAD